ncbi:MAG TPA: ABC transporter permease [Puia sp.]|uniref:ABC transporter permease n=1 Tax=Puia sp. TaxID=2045100 RepID=UPI002B8C2037|nr:ABC transporter permease [Puia sp.]HVU96517.1 ABC transporter permease [Puia sp.]
MFKSYWISAWRMLIRNRVYTLINVLGLALGICACFVIGIIVRYEFSFDRNHPGGKQIYRVVSYLQIMKDESEHLSPAVLADIPGALQQEIPGVEKVAPYHILNEDSAMVSREGKQTLYAVQSIVAGPEYLRVMGYDWLAGDPQTALAHPFSVVLTESRARRYFGMGPLAGIIGREIVYQDSLRVNVSGIVSDWPGNTDFPYTDFISFATIGHSFLLQTFGLAPGNKYPATASVLLRLAPTADPARVEGALSALYHRRNYDQGLYPRVALQPLSKVHFTVTDGNAGFQTSQLSILYALMSIAGFILALAIINYVNLATAQSLTREKEIGIRKVMGSGRGHLILQLLTETFLLTTVAGLFALLAVVPVLGVFREFVPAGIHFRPFAPVNVLFLAGITVTVTLLAGLYPARMLSAHSAVTSLKGNGTPRAGGKWLLRKGLIVFQFTVSLVFIIGTMVIGRQLGYMLHKDLGFRSDAIILFDTGERKDSVNKVRVLQQEIRQLPGVAEVSRSNMPPSGMDRGIATVRYLARSKDPLRVELIQSDEHYLPLYDIKLLAGRNLFPSDTMKEVLINENMSRELGFRRPDEALGKQLYTWNRNVSIVGVVADFHKYSYKEPIRPLMIAGMACTDLAVRLDTKGHSGREVRAAIARIERQWKTVYPHTPFEYGFFDEELAKFYKREQTMEWLLDIATGITLLISCIGLFGLTLFTTRRRTREIGIRKVMGADVKDIVILLGKDFVRLVLLALVIASAGGWYLTHRWLQDYAYRVGIGVDVFLLAGGVLMGLTSLTVGLQSMKAATVNPVESLRVE